MIASLSFVKTHGGASFTLDSRGIIEPCGCSWVTECPELPIIVCASLGKHFDIPETTTAITLSLWAEPAPGRVALCLDHWRCDEPSFILIDDELTELLSVTADFLCPLISASPTKTLFLECNLND